VPLKICDTCGGPRDVFDDPPCCLHKPSCAIGLCFKCNRVRWRGPCARELFDDMGWTRDKKPRK
jgi:hypothetical protein